MDPKAETLVGKKFTVKDPKHFAHGKVFEVIAATEFDFKGNGKKEPAVRVRRVGGLESRPSLKQFLAEFIPLESAEAEPAAPQPIE